MSASFYDLLKYAKTGIAAPDMTAYDKMRAVAMGGGGAIKTLTGVPPLTFKANGNPLVSWSMKGNGQQTGTPAPDAPNMPTFCGVRTGNVMPFAAAQTIANNGITFESDGKGGYTAKGYSAADASAVFQLSDTFTIPNSVGNGGNGTLSFWNTKVDSVVFDFMFNDTVIDGWSMLVVKRKHNAYKNLANQKCNAIRLSVTASKSCNQKIQPEFTDNGEYPTEFEPYGYKIPITCAGQTQNVYLGEVQTTRKIKNLVLTGEEGWNQNATSFGMRFFIRLENSVGSDTATIRSICTHYPLTYAGGTSAVANAYTISSNKNLYISSDTLNGVVAFKSWLAAQYSAGTPVTVWYVLAEPTTAIVNEPLCKIGDYADTLDSADAGITIPTVKGANTLTVDTDLQPSEMTITYRG